MSGYGDDFGAQAEMRFQVEVLAVSEQVFVDFGSGRVAARLCSDLLIRHGLSL